MNIMMDNLIYLAINRSRMWNLTHALACLNSVVSHHHVCHCLSAQDPAQLGGALDQGAQVHADQPEVGHRLGVRRLDARRAGAVCALGARRADVGGCRTVVGARRV